MPAYTKWDALHALSLHGPMRLMSFSPAERRTVHELVAEGLAETKQGWLFSSVALTDRGFAVLWDA